MSPELIRQYTVKEPQPEPLPKQSDVASTSSSSRSPSESSRVNEASAFLVLLFLGEFLIEEVEGDPKLVKLNFDDLCDLAFEDDEGLDRLACLKLSVATGVSASVLMSYSRRMPSRVKTQSEAPLKPRGCHLTLEMGVEAGPWKNSPTELRLHSIRSSLGDDQSLRRGKTMTTIWERPTRATSLGLDGEGTIDRMGQVISGRFKT